jgi:hypothetical protein
VNKIYISGPITNAGPDANKQKFKDMVLKIHHMQVGFPVSPRAHRIPPWLKLPQDQEEIWIYMMKLALIDLMDCNSMVLLDGWEDSKGCKAEVEIAKMLRMPIFNEHFIEIYHPRGDDRGILYNLDSSKSGNKPNNNSRKNLLLDQGTGDSLASFKESPKPFSGIRAPYIKKNK